MKICKSIASLLLCIAAVLRLLPVQVPAAGNIDLSRKGNLTITDNYDENRPVRRKMFFYDIT